MASTTYLNGVCAVVEHPLLSSVDAAKDLRIAITEFASWLNQEVQVNIWLPSINKNTSITIKRDMFIKMTGNLSKHNFLRTCRVAKALQSVLSRSDVSITLEEANSALSEFYERFHADVLNYHSSTIAEFLNNIRWGIYEYLRTLSQKSIVFDTANPPMYSYTYPTETISPYAKRIFCELMDAVRAPPYMKKFQVTRWLKLRY